MAIAPPRPRIVATPTKTPAEQHAEAVAALEFVLDAAARGKTSAEGYDGGPVVLRLPLGAHAPGVMADVEAHYLKAGWSKVETDGGHDIIGADDEPTGEKTPYTTLTLTP